MGKTLLKTVATAMDTLGVEYAFGVYEKNPIVYPYFVGEYNEIAPLTEDGLHETTFILNGFHRGSWLELETAKEKIEQYFNRVSGRTVIAGDHSAVAIFYENSLIVPTGNAEFKRIQVNLKAKEWKVN